ncbi:MAG: hypothetical protein RJB62_1464 [Pseudomonadota bacterium]|jgi:cyclase
MKYVFGLAGIAAALLFAGGASAQLPTDFSQTVITTTPLRGNTYMLMGEGGNITVAVGSDSILVVDSQFAPLYERIKAAITAISDLPVRYLVNTHHHGDHIGGNALFAADGATIVSQANMRTLLETGTVNGLTGNVTPPAAAEALPAETFDDMLTLRFGGRDAELGHPVGAHTSGDSFVRFRDADVLATGDIVTFGRYPNIDFANGGNINQMIEATDAYIAMVDDDTIIVPGHGALGNKESLIDYRAMLATSRDRVAALIAEGKTVDEIIAARPNADYDTAMNVDETRIGNWIRVVYYSLAPR